MKALQLTCGVLLGALLMLALQSCCREARELYPQLSFPVGEFFWRESALATQDETFQDVRLVFEAQDQPIDVVYTSSDDGEDYRVSFEVTETYTLRYF